MEYLAPVAAMLAAMVATYFVSEWMRRKRAQNAIDNAEFHLSQRRPEAPMLPRRWGWGTVAVYAVQAAAIAGLIYVLVTPIGYEGEPTPHPIAAVVGSVIIVAFGTALLANLWAWLTRRFDRDLKGSVPVLPGRGGSGRDTDEPRQERVGAPRPYLGGREVSEERSRGRIG